MDERDRALLQPYPYNSFHLLQERLTEVDLKQLAERILSWPVQVEIEVDGQPYLLAHACTAEPGKWKLDNYYLMGICGTRFFFMRECMDIFPSAAIRTWEMDPSGRIKENVYLCDCGCGFENGRLGCLCLKRRKLSTYKQTEEKQ